MIIGIIGFLIMVIGIGLITDSSVRMRGGVTRPKAGRSALIEMGAGIVVGMAGFAMVIYAITGGQPVG